MSKKALAASNFSLAILIHVYAAITIIANITNYYVCVNKKPPFFIQKNQSKSISLSVKLPPWLHMRGLAVGRIVACVLI